MKLRRTLTILGLIAGVSAFALPATPTQAVDGFTACTGSAAASSQICKGKGEQATSTVKTIINLLIYVIGIAAVIMIIIGGLRYTLSGGDQAGINNAKNTILYAVVGLVIAVMAFTIVNFVLSWL